MMKLQLVTAGILTLFVIGPLSRPVIVSVKAIALGVVIIVTISAPQEFCRARERLAFQFRQTGDNSWMHLSCLISRNCGPYQHSSVND